MNDIIYNIRQFIRTLNDARSSALSIWRDNAEREISSRYVTPMFDVANQIQVNSERLNDTVNDAVRLHNTANENCKEARELSTQIIELLREVASELDNVANQINSIDAGIHQLQTDCDAVRDLLSQANNIGNSAAARTPPPPEPGLIFRMVYALVSGAVDITANGIGNVVDVTTGMAYKLTGADESN